VSLRGLTILAGLLAVLLSGCGPNPTTSLPTTRPGGEYPTTQPATTAITTTVAAVACPQVLVGCPRPDVTPGAVIPSDAGVCTTSYNPRRELTTAAKRRVLAAYGIPPGTRIAELDHLIPRWAGGRSDPTNVWPQVDPAEVARKDALEDHDYRAVCVTRTMTLAEARHRAAHFWRWW
jgi:hypothetical protein